MAFTYGSVTNCKVANGQTRSEYECRLGYELQSQDIVNNCSTFTLRLEVRSISSSYYTYGYKQTTKIEDTTLSAQTFDMRSTNTWQKFGEITVTRYHDEQGRYQVTKTGSFTTTASSGYSLKSGNASVYVNLYIPRYATANQSLRTKSVNSISMNWSSDSTIDYIWYSINNGSSWTAVGGVNATSGTYTISGLSPYSTYNIKTRVRRKDSQLTTDSSTLAVTTYNYAVISSAPAFNLGSSETITYNNDSGSAIKVAIYTSDGQTALAAYRAASSYYYTFSFTDAELDAMYKKMGTGNSITVRVYVQTTCNGSTYATYTTTTVTLTGNQKTGHVGVSGVQKRAKVFVGVNGSVKRAVIWVGNNGRKRCI